MGRTSIAVIGARRRRRNTGSGSIVVVSDTFTRADNVSSMGSTESGTAGVKPWTPLTGTWGVISNQGYCAGVSGNTWTVVDAGVADGTVSVVLNSVATEAGLIGRVTDASNGYRFVWSGGSVFLQKQVATAFTSLAGSVAHPFVAGETYSLRCSGTAISGLINGVVIISATDATFGTQTKWGLEIISGSDRVDNFTVTVP